MDPKYLLVLAVAIIMGWYALGMIYNVRHGEALVRWMQGGLKRLGEKTTFRWLGSSVAELVMAQAKSPAKRAEVLAVLAPRDVPWTWLYSLARGRKDIVIIRLDLAHAPRLALELADPHTWTGRMAIDDAKRHDWVSREYAGKTLLAPAGLLDMTTEYLERLSAAQPLPDGFHRFGLRKDAAHFEIHVPFPNVRKDDPDVFFSGIKELAEKVIGN